MSNILIGDFMKNIIFDLGGVILKDRPISVLNGLDDGIYNELKIFFDDWNDLDLGNISLLDKFNECNFSYDIQMKYKDRLLNYCSYRELNTDLLKLIEQLKLKKYNVYILSDCNFVASEYYKKVLKNIDGWVMSCEYHTMKREGKLFDILLDKFCLVPSECYYIDDNVNNIIEAKKHNINCFVFTDNDSLYNDMRINNIKI